MEMATDENLFVIHMHLQRFTGVLTSAACEWFLIVLLFIDAALSYVLTKFAEYCKLQTPCILCSRIDHVIGSKNPGFYWNLVCSNHIFEISSLIFCHIHDNIADGFGMCEDCIISFTKKNKSNSKTPLILAEKLDLDIGGSGFQSSLLNRNVLPGSVGTRPCSCCNTLCRSRQNAQRLPQIKSGTRVVPIPNIPSSQLLCQSHVNHLDNLKNIKSNVSSSEATSLGKSSNGSKTTSDYKSEVLYFKHDDDRSNICERNHSEDNSIHQCASKNSPKAPSSDFLATKWTSHSCKSEPLLSDLCVQHDHIKGYDVSSLSSDVSEECISGEVDEKPANQNPNPCVNPDQIFLIEGTLPSNVIETPNGENTEKNKITILHLELKDSNPSNFLDDTSSLLGLLLENCDIGASGIGHIYINKQKEVLRLIDTSAGSTLGNDTVITKSVSTKTKDINASNEGKLASSNKEGERPDITAERHMINESDRMDQEPKLLSSENSSSQQNKSSSGKVQINSSFSEIQTLPKSALLESGLESLDGSNISEIEGESTVDRLRRQIESDKKCMNALYEELEEERNAAAVATDEAMAMITRLQQEKAALNMEALQYLRMMEEQAEHDVDALEKANDLLAEKEKEIQDLEAELDYYRMTFPEETKIENLHEESGKGNKVDKEVVTCKNDPYSRIIDAWNGSEQAERDEDALEKANDLLCEKEKEIQDLEAELDYYRMNFPKETTIGNLHEKSCDLKGKYNKVENEVVTCKNKTNSMITDAWNGCDDPFTPKTQCLEFEDEKSYLAQCLKRLEGRIRQMSFKGTNFNTSNDRHTENISGDGHNDEESGKRDELLINAYTEEHKCDLNKEDFHVGDGSTVAQENALVSSGGDGCLSSKEKNHIESDRQKSSFQERDIDLDALENEISDLNDRLEALEADHDFLEHMLNTIQNGNKEGLQFIQEIAQQLQELRKAGIR